jgi:hypothetical protein
VQKILYACACCMMVAHAMMLCQRETCACVYVFCLGATISGHSGHFG